jgi:hypothetical protein
VVIVDPWPCLREDCVRAGDCVEETGQRDTGPCGYYGGDGLVEADVPSEFADDPAGYLADGTPLPDEPVDDVEPEPWDPQPIRAEEIPVEVPALDAAGQEYDPVPTSEEERAARAARVAAARRVHVAPPAPTYLRLGAEFDPRGRHVGCDGEPAPAGGMTGGCGAAPGEACRPPGTTSGRRRFVPGFVHPTRVAAERMMFGLDEASA